MAHRKSKAGFRPGQNEWIRCFKGSTIEEEQIDNSILGEKQICCQGHPNTRFWSTGCDLGFFHPSKACQEMLLDKSLGLSFCVIDRACPRPQNPAPEMQSANGSGVNHRIFIVTQGELFAVTADLTFLWSSL